MLLAVRDHIRALPEEHQVALVDWCGELQEDENPIEALQDVLFRIHNQYPWWNDKEYRALSGYMTVLKQIRDTVM
jgi:hypothetical protein